MPEPGLDMFRDAEKSHDDSGRWNNIALFFSHSFLPFFRKHRYHTILGWSGLHTNWDMYCNEFGRCFKPARPSENVVYGLPRRNEEGTAYYKGCH